MRRVLRLQLHRRKLGSGGCVEGVGLRLDVGRRRGGRGREAPDDDSNAAVMAWGGVAENAQA